MYAKKIISLFLILTAVLIMGCSQKQATTAEPAKEIAAEEQVIEDYSPEINPANFAANVTNKYFALVPGRKMIYEGETEDGTERIEVYVMRGTKQILGVNAVVVWDRVWLEGELIEDTKDWYAQDKEGNVWYFGEDSKEIIGGKIASTEGSWESGIDGAKPGIIMKANPQIGDSYRQEYYKGNAEDMADVLALNETVNVPQGNFTNCLKTRDWTPLEPGADEHKYYCPSVGGVVLEVVIENGERVELIGITTDEVMETVEVVEELKANVTEEKAKEIALNEVLGKVTDVAIERKFGKIAYVIEIDADEGPETDVIIDIETGEVLGVET